MSARKSHPYNGNWPTVRIDHPTPGHRDVDSRTPRSCHPVTQEVRRARQQQNREQRGRVARSASVSTACRAMPRAAAVDRGPHLMRCHRRSVKCGVLDAANARRRSACGPRRRVCLQSGDIRTRPAARLDHGPAEVTVLAARQQNVRRRAPTAVMRAARPGRTARHPWPGAPHRAPRQ
jgi:hypothetical protein